MDEANKIFLILEDAYWRLKDLDTQDFDEDTEEEVDELITALDQYFAQLDKQEIV